MDSDPSRTIVIEPLEVASPRGTGASDLIAAALRPPQGVAPIAEPWSFALADFHPAVAV